MATNVLYVQQFPAPPEAVWAMLTDIEYIRTKGLRSGSLEVEPDVELLPTRTIIISRRRLPARIPGFMKKFVGDVVVVNETQQWEQVDSQGSRHGTFVIDFGGQPMAFHGGIALRSSAGGTAVTTEGTLKSTVPIVGKKAESVAKDWTERYLRKEEEVALDWLGSASSAG